MAFLIAGLAVFFAAHMFSTLRSRAEGRNLRVRMGEGPYRGVFSLVSLAGFALIVYGYDAARPAPVLYVPPVWGRHLNLVLMAVAMVLLVAAYAPTGRIKAAVKHPMLAAVKVWAFGHLLVNGDVASLLLFGSFLAYAVVARIAAKRRGDDRPGPDAPRSAAGDVAALAGGGVACAAVAFYLHPVLFGVPALA